MGTKNKNKNSSAKNGRYPILLKRARKTHIFDDFEYQEACLKNVKKGYRRKRVKNIKKGVPKKDALGNEKTTKSDAPDNCLKNETDD